MNMKRLIIVLILFLCYINAVGQVYTLNNLFNEYRASYDINYTSFTASLDGNYLTITSKDKYGHVESVRLDIRSTKVTCPERQVYEHKYRFIFRDDNGLDYIYDGKKYLRDSWSFSCDSNALKNKTEQALNNIFSSPKSTSSTKPSNPSSATSSSTSSSSSTTTTAPTSDKKTYSCKHFSIKYPNSWKTVIVGDPNSTTSNLTNASVTVRITNPGQGQPVRNIAINMDPYVDWSQIDQSSLPFLKTPIKRQYPDATFVSEPEFIRFASLSGIKMVYTAYMGGFKARFINYVIHKQNGFTYYITACLEDSKASSQTKEINDIINTLIIK